MSGSRGAKPGVYLIVIDGLPELYTWQDLKDFVRPEAEHEFWADLQSVPNGSRQKRGCIRTQRWTEAGNLFKYLSRQSVNGRRLAVVLWDISGSPPKQIAPTPGQAMPEPQTKWASKVANGNTSWPSIIPAQAAQPRTQPYSSQATLAQSMEALSLQQRQQQQAAYYAQQQQQQQKEAQAAYYAAQVQQLQQRRESAQAQVGSSRSPPEYVSSVMGTPVNIRDGVARTVSRGIFVSGINFKAREEDVKHKFSSVGDIVRCSLHKDASGKSKGVATILFSTSLEAQNAIDRYNRATWMDKKLVVRVDKEATTLAAPPRLDPSPLIVNGSRVH